MKKKFLIISLAMSGFAFSQNSNKISEFILLPDTNKVEIATVTQKKNTSVRCGGTSKSTGNQCKLKTKHESTLCHHHRK